MMKMLKILTIAALTITFSNQARAESVEISTTALGDAEYYTVKAGDTLWDISETFFGDPFTWPDLWKKNPDIANPHLIFPGDVLRITAEEIIIVHRKEELPVIPLVDEEPIEDEGPPTLRVKKLMPEEPKVVVKVEPVEVAAPEPPPAPEPEEVVKSHRIVRNGFISKDDLTETGLVAEGLDKDKTMLYKNEEAFVSFKDTSIIKVDDIFTIFSIEGELTHPVTNEVLGNRTNILGILKIIEISNGAIISKITKSYREIPHGARLRPHTLPKTDADIISSTETVNGVVVASIDGRKIMASGAMLFIDKGADDGLTDGNVLVVFLDREPAKDPLDPEKLIELPPRRIGSIVIISVMENISTALVMKSTEPIMNGYRVATPAFFK